MRKILTLSLCLLMLVATVLTGCNNADNTANETPEASAVKFGAGVYVSTPVTADATEDKNGSGKLDVTVAAVTVDADGKIVSCALDTASNTVNFTLDGKAIANEEFKTKYEMGDAYNMVAYGGAAEEWYRQADTFETFVAGKTLDEVKALVAEGNKGTEAVMTAGCTIMINEFVGAIEKAYNAAKAEVAADDVLKVRVATEQTCTDATEEKDGSNKLTVNVFAAATDAEGKVTAASSDCIDVSFTFDMSGVSTLDTAKEVLSKKEQGDNYGMVAYGGAKLEWYEQAEVFDTACIGKTAEEIASISAEELQTAGCTVDAAGFVKAASKN